MRPVSVYATSAIAVTIVGMPCVGQTITEDFRLVGDDADTAPFNGLGGSVALSGTTAVLGARVDDDAAFNAGAAYVFDLVTGLQRYKLTADDAEIGDAFGGTVAIADSVALIGAPYRRADVAESGAAYLFDPVSGNQLHRLFPLDDSPPRGFGGAVAVSDTLAVVGATSRANDQSGAVYVFDVATGDQLTRLTASDSDSRDRFGDSVALFGTTVLVGAPGIDDVGPRSGAAYVFDAITGEQLARLTPDDGFIGDLFGNAVDLFGTTAIVGAVSEGDPDAVATGSAYLFDITTGQQLFKLRDAGAAEGDSLGVSVAISGSIALVSGVRGVTFLFDVGTGQQIAGLTTSAGPNPYYAVGLDGLTALVGPYVFDLSQVATPCSPADLAAPFASLTFADITAFLTAFANQDPAADLAEPVGQFTFADISAFLAAFSAGCP